MKQNRSFLPPNGLTVIVAYMQWNSNKNNDLAQFFASKLVISKVPK